MVDVKPLLIRTPREKERERREQIVILAAREWSAMQKDFAPLAPLRRSTANRRLAEAVEALDSLK